MAPARRTKIYGVVTLQEKVIWVEPKGGGGGEFDSEWGFPEPLMERPHPTATTSSEVKV